MVMVLGSTRQTHLDQLLIACPALSLRKTCNYKKEEKDEKVVLFLECVFYVQFDLETALFIILWFCIIENCIT